MYCHVLDTCLMRVCLSVGVCAPLGGVGATLMKFHRNKIATFSSFVIFQLVGNYVKFQKTFVMLTA